MFSVSLKCDIIDKVRTFENRIKGYILNPEKVCLIAVSFGPDSMALLHRLHRLQNLRLHVVHVNHQLRSEAAQEENDLKDYCQKLGIPISIYRLNKLESSSNLEDQLRNLRYTYFSQVYKELKAQAIFLGHQKDEQVETGIKRFFEGASFAKLSGMSGDSTLFGMRVLRPQLMDTKADLLEYLQHHQIPFCVDHTNFSPQFLRGKMRCELLPELEIKFGKSISQNVYNFMVEADNLARYLDKKIKPVLEKVVTGPYGNYLPIESIVDLDSVELNHIMVRLHVTNRNTRQRVLEYFFQKRIGKKVEDKECACYVERQGIFFLKKELAPQDYSQTMSKERGWLSFWKGNIGYHQPQQQQNWIDPKQKKCANWDKIIKKYSKNNIPIFLRNQVYVLEDQGKVIYEFLTL
jgi:tRNA(Ile)-lysidine synthetase-like protein